MADITRRTDSEISTPPWSRIRWDSPWWVRRRPYCRPTRRARIELAGTVTINSIGSGVSGASLTVMNPTPPISNCLGKLVMLTVGLSSATPTVSISGATYYLAAKSTGNYKLAVYIKNGEATEPTPNVDIASTTGQMGSWITVYDISGGAFPTIAADGQGVLGSHYSNVSSGVTTAFYNDLTCVGGGFSVQFCMKPTTGAGWSFSSVDISAEATNAGNAVKTAGASNIVVCAQRWNGVSVNGATVFARGPAINTNTSSTGVDYLTIEFATAASGGGGSGARMMGGGMQSLTGGMRG